MTKQSSNLSSAVAKLSKNPSEKSDSARRISRKCSSHISVGKKPTNRNSVFPNGQRLRELRGQLGLTQLELSFRLDFSERLVRKAEKGQRIETRSLSTFQQFFELKGLNVTLKDLTHNSLSNKQIAIQWFHDCWIARDFNSMNCCGTQISFSVGAIQSQGRGELRAQLKKHLIELKGFKFQMVQVVADGNQVVLLWTAREHHNSDSKSSLRGTAYFQFADHSVIRFQDNWMVSGETN